MRPCQTELDVQARNSLSVAMVACNEEANIARTLASVIDLADEINLVDSGSTRSHAGDCTLVRSQGQDFRGAVEGLCAAEEFRHRQGYRRLGTAAGRR